MGPGSQPRPTTDRIRESIFNLLAHGPYGEPAPPEGRRVLDLFAGTGALGLEALSRGAERVLFVEEEPYARGLIRENVERLHAMGETKLYRRDATRLGPCRDAPYDLVFADPPYRMGLAPKALASAIEGGWLAPGALVVIETAADEPPLAAPGFTLEDERIYGDSRITILRHGGA